MGSLVAMIAAVAVILWAAPRQAINKNNRSLLRAAFTFAAVGLTSLLTGILGYSIRRGGDLPYLEFANQVIWPQIWFGAAALILAALFWRVGYAQLVRRTDH